MLKPEQKKYIDEFLNEMRNVMITKGSDYSGNEDTLKNLRLLAPYGYKTEEGILLRIGDKVSRLASLIKKDGKPNHESLHDNILDLANYACLFAMLMEEKKEKAKRTHKKKAVIQTTEAVLK